MKNLILINDNIILYYVIANIYHCQTGQQPGERGLEGGVDGRSGCSMGGEDRRGVGSVPVPVPVLILIPTTTTGCLFLGHPPPIQSMSIFLHHTVGGQGLRPHPMYCSCAPISMGRPPQIILSLIVYND